MSEIEYLYNIDKQKDPWLIFLENWALVESNLKNNIIQIKDFKSLHSKVWPNMCKKLKELKNIKVSSKNKAKKKKITRINRNNVTKTWTCEFCCYQASGKHVYALKMFHKNRTKSCPGFRNRKKAAIFTHSDSPCLCCVTQNRGGQKNYFSTVL